MNFNEEERVPIAELAPHDGARLHLRFLDYWLRLRGRHAMPSYADLDPVDFPWALPNIFVVEILPGGDFVYRIAGEEHTQRYRRNLKGLRLSDIMQSDAAEAITERWRLILDMPAAFFILTDHHSEQGASVLGERLVLPLGNDRATPTHLVGITNFLSTSSFAGSLTGDQKVKYFRWSRVEPDAAFAEPDLTAGAQAPLS
ncbi:PAS domain-containing protein [Nisaea sediminum]|uniref:PAS domain-containing protein n=1 Tax=Nisaea sediminum TaxID=2775867 RepID=UPI0018662B04|nr:PAS domain-containing protein [Nisaea sediminum]